MLLPIYTPVGFSPTYQFCDAVHDLPANQNPQSQTLGWGPEPAAGQTRHLIIGLAFITSSGVAPSSVTVGGDAATLVVANAPAGAPTAGEAIYIVEKPTGTSGNVSFSVSSGDIDGGCIAVWAAYNLVSATAVDTAVEATNNTGVGDLSVDTLADGAVFAVASIVTAAAVTGATWVGVTQDSADEDASDLQWVASAFNVAAATPRTVQFSALVSAVQRRIHTVAASFR